jgi:hypothetical protein
MTYAMMYVVRTAGYSPFARGGIIGMRRRGDG